MNGAEVCATIQTPQRAYGPELLKEPRKFLRSLTSIAAISAGTLLALTGFGVSSVVSHYVIRYAQATRNNGRTGMGLVKASKNLKAIVVKGREKIDLANPAALSALNKAGPKMMPENPDVDALGTHGTASVLLPQNMMGTLPTYNYNEAQFIAAEEISGERMTETILKKRETCHACVVRCKRVVEITDGPHKVHPLYGGPEYETLGTFGSYCGVRDLAAVAEANQICNMYGVDTISCGATIAFAMECYR